MSSYVNNFELPIRRRLDSQNHTYYMVCSGFWSTLRCLLETEHLARAAFEYVQAGLPEHFVVEAATEAQAADAAIRLLPLTRERYIYENDPDFFTRCDSPRELLARTCATADGDSGPERVEMEVLTAWAEEQPTGRSGVLPTKGRPHAMPLFVPQECVDNGTSSEMYSRRSQVVVLQTPDFEWGDTNLLYANGSDWPVFSIGQPSDEWYGKLLSNYYYDLTDGWHMILSWDCKKILSKLKITCENDLIEACDYVRRHEGPRAVDSKNFLQAVRDVPRYGKLRGFNLDKSAVLCRADHAVSRRLPQAMRNAMMIACSQLESSLPKPYTEPTNESIQTEQGRTLVNHMLNQYGDAPCMSGGVATLLHMVQIGSNCCMDEAAIDPDASFGHVLQQAEECYMTSNPNAHEAYRIKPDQWMLVLDAEPFMMDSDRLKSYRFAIHLTADGGEVYEGPQALRKFGAGARAMLIDSLQNPGVNDGCVEEY